MKNQKNKNLVSVIINCHNNLEYLNQCINSVLKQDYQNLELILWDNASDDPIKELIDKFNDQRIRYYRNNNFLRLGEVRNKALKKVKGEYIAFLDSDDYWEITKLNKQISLFNRNKDVGLIYSDAKMFHGDKITVSSLTKKHPPEGSVFKLMLSQYFLVMSSVVLRSSVLNNLDEWFDKRFEIIEEYDLFLRICKNTKVKCVNEPLTYWRWHNNSTTMKKRKLIPKEKKLLLKKLSRKYDNFSKDYAEQIRSVKGKIIISMSLTQYYNHNSKNCRRILKKSKTYNLKGIIVYFLSFFPIHISDFLYRKIKGNPLV